MADEKKNTWPMRWRHNGSFRQRVMYFINHNSYGVHVIGLRGPCDSYCDSPCRPPPASGTVWQPLPRKSQRIPPREGPTTPRCRPDKVWGKGSQTKPM